MNKKQRLFTHYFDSLIPTRKIAYGLYTYKDLLYVYVKKDFLVISLFDEKKRLLYEDIASPKQLRDSLDAFCVKTIKTLREIDRGTSVKERRRVLRSRSSSEWNNESFFFIVDEKG